MKPVIIFNKILWKITNEKPIIYINQWQNLTHSQKTKQLYYSDINMKENNCCEAFRTSQNSKLKITSANRIEGKYLHSFNTNSISLSEQNNF